MSKISTLFLKKKLRKSYMTYNFSKLSNNLKSNNYIKIRFLLYYLYAFKKCCKNPVSLSQQTKKSFAIECQNGTTCTFTSSLKRHLTAFDLIFQMIDVKNNVHYPSGYPISQHPPVFLCSSPGPDPYSSQDLYNPVYEELSDADSELVVGTHSEDDFAEDELSFGDPERRLDIPPPPYRAEAPLRRETLNRYEGSGQLLEINCSSIISQTANFSNEQLLE